MSGNYMTCQTCSKGDIPLTRGEHVICNHCGQQAMIPLVGPMAVVFIPGTANRSSAP